MHHPTDRITHTTAFVTPVVEHWLEREIAQWVHPMKDRSDDPPHHERTLYLWATSRSYLKTVLLLIGNSSPFGGTGFLLSLSSIAIGNSSPCSGSGFPLSLSEWSFTICPTPYNRKQNELSASLNKTFPFLSKYALWKAESHDQSPTTAANK